MRELAKRYDGKRDWVLVTGDDAMPAEHGEVIIQARATIAVLSPVRPEGVTLHHWRTDVAHRWAHAFQEQKPETVRRYNLNGSAAWSPRRRHLRDIAKHAWTPWRPDDAQKAAAARNYVDVAENADPEEPERLPGIS